MKEDVELVHEPERIKILLEETRRNILSLLKIDNMAISQIAEALGKDRSTIYRHVKKLEEYGFVELKGERIVHHIPEMIYGRTAKLFLPCPKSMEPDDPAFGSLDWNEKKTRKILQGIDILGYKNDISDELVKKVSKFFTKLNNEIINLMEEKGVVEMSFLETLRLKVLIILIELNQNPEMEEKIEKLIDHFDRP